MSLHKIRNGGHILWCLLWANVFALGCGFARGPISGVREIGRITGRLFDALRAIVVLHGRDRIARLVELCLQSGVSRKTLSGNPETAYFLAKWLNDDQKYEEAIALLAPFIQPEARFAKFHGMRGMAHLGLGRYAEALADLIACHALSPRLARDFQHNLHRAYLHGLRGETEAARSAMADQLLSPNYTGTVEEGLAALLAARLLPYLNGFNLHGSVGVVIGNFGNAVGHAILDPFHFIQLNRGRFDCLILAHPPYQQYTPATRLASSILDSYVEQVAISDQDVLHFAWQSLGELRHGTLTFIVHNYWSLNRMAYRARTSPDHSMAHGREYLSLPPRVAARADAVCRWNRLKFNRPIVVVHTREHGYHALHGQKYRNTDINNYIPALLWLTTLGYQVIRIGDKKMHSVRREVPGLIELPTTEFYDPVLDPYLISRCEFMISCQSGPCSYARVLGKPNLVVNAVYHYTLLPENNELIAFKQYRRADTGRALSVEEVFRAGGHKFDRTEHFEAAGIEVEDMTPDEILVATEEMVGWLNDPARPESPAQQAFREMMLRFSVPKIPADPLANPIADYIGYALPECRISDAVCQIRPGCLATHDEQDETPLLRAA